MQIGEINVNECSTYVAVERGIAQQVVRKLSAGKVKGAASSCGCWRVNLHRSRRPSRSLPSSLSVEPPIAVKGA
jgi:hypothetical protein